MTTMNKKRSTVLFEVGHGVHLLMGATYKGELMYEYVENEYRSFYMCHKDKEALDEKAVNHFLNRVPDYDLSLEIFYMWFKLTVDNYFGHDIKTSSYNSHDKLFSAMGLYGETDYSYLDTIEIDK